MRNLSKTGVAVAMLLGASCQLGVANPPLGSGELASGTTSLRRASQGNWFGQFGGGTEGPSESAPAPSIAGIVEFPRHYQTQATPAQVIGQATVSLIDTVSGITAASGLTDPAGNFTLNLGAYVPIGEATYLLEASKGLVAQLPGFVIARMRTIVQYKAAGSITGAPGWLSITNSGLPGTVLINSWTTALAIEAGLDPANVSPATTMGKVNGSLGLNPTPVYTGHSDAEIIATRSDINAYLTANLDPVGTLSAIKPNVISVSPSSANAYGIVTLTGSGFSPVAGGSTVTIGGVAAPVLVATPTQLVIQVPVGAVSGNVVVATARGGAGNLTAFTVPDGSAVGISALSPSSVDPGAPINVTGWGYSAVAANNVVVFRTATSTVSATPTEAYPGSLVVPVPSSAINGNITVTVGGATSNAFFLTVASPPVPIDEVFPTKATRYGEFYVYGPSFGSTAGTIKVGGIEAGVLRWRNTFVHARLDGATATGPQNVVVTTSAGVSSTTATLQVLTGVVGTFASLGTIPFTYAYVPKVWTHKYLYILGNEGVAGTLNVLQFPVLTDGSINFAGMVDLGPILPFATGACVISGLGWSLPGQRYWIMQKDSANKAYVTFNDTNGVLLSVTNLGAVGFSQQYCSYVTGGPKALYAGAGNTPAPYTQMAYALILSDGSLTAWTNIANNPAGVDGSMHVIGNTLWTVEQTGGVMRSTPIAADGSLSAASGWTDRGTAHAGEYNSFIARVGDYFYIFGTNVIVGGANTTKILRAPIVGGELTPVFTDVPNGQTLYNTVNLFNSGVVIGGYLYTGSNSSTPASLYRAAITS